MKKTRLLALLLATVMVLTTLAAIPMTASADGWDGEERAMPAGEGTKEKPFLIASAENLAWVSYMTEHYTELNELLGTSYASTNVFEDKYFVQTADIDLNGKGFAPIGKTQSSNDAKRNAFAGEYDGRHYKIANGVIRPAKTASQTAYSDFTSGGYTPCGIFGVVSTGAVISNINASNLKIGEIRANTTIRGRIYTSTVSGGIVATTWGNAMIVGCTTDADCEIYGFYAAGGILGMPEGGAMVTRCVNNAKVSSNTATGGIVGTAYNTDISYCVNNGQVQHYSIDDWTGVGGIVGTLHSRSGNTSNTISYCVNSANAEVGAISFQAPGSSNRIEVAGIVGDDNKNPNADIFYSHCYNLQQHFTVKYLDNGNSAANYLALVGGLVGYTRDTATETGLRKYDKCYSVACDYTYDWTELGAETVNGYKEKTKTFDCSHSEQATPDPAYAGLIGAELNPSQFNMAIGDPATVMATCAYGVTAAEIEAKPEYQAILSLAKSAADRADAPKYVGVQETLDRGEGYSLRFILAAAGTDYHKAGAEVVATYANGEAKTYTLTAEKYYGTVVGNVGGTITPYTAASFGAVRLMALSQKIDLAAMGAVTYTVTPFFVRSEGGEASYGRAWTVNYAADGSFTSHEIVEESVVDDDTESYTIVYPTDSVKAPVYTAVALQYHVLIKTGIKLPLAAESSADENAYEIVIAEDGTLAPGAYKSEVVGNRLVISANDQFGYIAAATRLVRTVFPSGRIQLDENCNTMGSYEREMLTEHAGTTRVIFQNAWYRGGAGSELFDNVTGYEYQLALVATYRPDVIGLNEYLDGWRASGFAEAMAEIGYIEVKPQRNGVDVDLGNAIFYNSATTDYVEGSSDYLSYGKCEYTDADGDGILETQRRNTGELAGRFWDFSDNLGETAHVATFTSRETGQSYTVCATHFQSNANVDPQIAPYGNQIRLEQVERLVPFLKDYQAEYGATILVGGDYNSADSYEEKEYKAAGGDPVFISASDTYTDHNGNQIPYLRSACDELRANGFINTHNETANTAYNGSAHGYPVWNADLKAYVGYSASLDDSNYASSIDHIYALESFDGELETVAYRNLSIETILSSSDHKPVLIDFNLTEDDGSGDGGSGDSGETPENAWQGMSDYAAPTSGSGTEADPYLIETPQHLAWLALATNDVSIADAFLGNAGESRNVFVGVHFKQTADIDLAGLAFTPIGDYQSNSDYTQRRGFAGIYDGDGFAIKNARINACFDNSQAVTTAGYSSDTRVSGIFGLITANAVVKNVNAKNVKVGKLLSEYASTVAETYGESVSGVIVGMAIASTVTGCTTDADCAAIGVYAGGIVAYQREAAEISYCVNNASVLGANGVGGIVGSADTDTLTYCINNADISMITFGRWCGVGGIIGLYNNGSKSNAISYCINTGAISAIDRLASGDSHRVGMGGIVGNDNVASTASYDSCFNLATKFTAKVDPVGNTTNFLACSGGIAGYAKDDPSARVYTNCYSVAGTTDVDYFGTPKNDFAWNGKGMNGSAGVNTSIYAGLLTGELNDTQVANSVSGATNNTIATAFATCKYGASVSEIEANAAYQAILAALEA